MNSAIDVHRLQLAYTFHYTWIMHRMRRGPHLLWHHQPAEWYLPT
jgi:hypothetical protein